MLLLCGNLWITEANFIMLKILCLHGSEQNSEIFRSRLGRLPHKSRHVVQSFRVVDAPHSLPIREGDDVPLRTWYKRNSDGSLIRDTLECSVDMLEQLWVSDGPFDGMLGFSMGGSVAVYLATMPSRFPGLKFVFVAGAPDKLQASIDDSVPTINMPSLHVIGQRDNVVTVKHMTDLANRFCHDSCEIIMHEQGHCIPSKAVFLNQYVSWLEKQHKVINDAKDIIVNPSISSTNTPVEVVNGTETESASSSIPMEPVMPLRATTFESQCEEIGALVAIYGTSMVSVDYLSSMYEVPEILSDCYTATSQPTHKQALLNNTIIKVAFDFPLDGDSSSGSRGGTAYIYLFITLLPSYLQIDEASPPSNSLKFQLETDASLSLLDFPGSYRANLLSLVVCVCRPPIPPHM